MAPTARRGGVIRHSTAATRPAEGAPGRATPPDAPEAGLTTLPVHVTLKLPKTSQLKKKALAIIALRAQGLPDAEIAASLGIQTRTIHVYLYRAGKMGLLRDPKTGGSVISDPVDQVEYELSHKVIRNLNEFMDSDDADLRKAVTLEVAKGALFKKFDPAKDAAVPQLNVLSVKIEMPSSGSVPARAGAIGGTPAYVEGEVATDRGDNE